MLCGSVVDMKISWDPFVLSLSARQIIVNGVRLNKVFQTKIVVSSSFEQCFVCGPSVIIMNNCSEPSEISISLPLRSPRSSAQLPRRV